MSKISNDQISATIDINGISETQEKILRLRDSIKSLNDQNKEYRREITRLTKLEGDHSQEFKRLNDAIDANTKTIHSNKDEVIKLETSIGNVGKTYAQLSRQLKKLKGDLNNTSKVINPDKYHELETQIVATEKAMREASKSTRSFWERLRDTDKIGTTIKGFFMGLAAAIGTQVIGAFKSLKNTIMEFSAENSRLAAILGTTKEGIKELTQQAKELGRTTSFTASQVTGLQVELAKLGFTQKQIEDMTPSVLKFSKAVGTDLASAAAFSGAALRIFGKESNEIESVLATLAIATTKSSLDFSKLEASIATIGPVAAAYGLSLEDTTALLGSLANAGFDASSAATATRNILLNLCDTNGKLAKALGGPVKNLDDLVSGLNKLSSEGIDLNKMLELTDKRSVSAFSNFIKQSDAILKLRDSITDVNVEFNQMANTMADNAKAAEAGFFSAIEGFILQFGGLDNVLAGLYKTGTSIVQVLGWILNLFTPFVNILKLCGNTVTYVAKSIGELISRLTSFGGGTNAVNNALKALKVVLSALVSAWLTYKSAVMLSSTWTKISTVLTEGQTTSLTAQKFAVTSLTKAWQAFKSAFIKHPFGVVITLVVSLIASMVALKDETEDAADAQKTLNERQAEAIAKYGQEKRKIEELRKVAMSQNEAYDKRLKAIEALNKIIPDYNASLDKETGKYRENSKALGNYLELLKKKFILESFKDGLQKLMKADADKQMEYVDEYNQRLYEFDKNRKIAHERGPNSVSGADANAALLGNGELPLIIKNGKAIKNPRYKPSNVVVPGAGERPEYIAIENAQREELKNISFQDWYKRKHTDESKAVDDYVKNVKAMGYDLSEIFSTDMTDATTDLGDGFKGLGAAAHDTVDEIKRLKDELKQLRKEEATTDAEYKRIEERKTAISERLKVLKGKKSSKSKHKRGTYSEDSIDQVTAPIDDEHQKKLLEINKSKDTVSEAKYAIARNQELIRYNARLVKELSILKENTDKTHLQTIDKINAEINKAMANGIKAQQELNTINNKQLADNYEKRVAAAQAYYDTQEVTMQEAVAKQNITQEAADIYLMAKQHELHETQLKELQDYKSNVEAAESMSAEQRQALLLDLADKIRKAQSQVLTDTGKWSELMREMTTNAASPEGLKQRLDMEVSSVAQQYDTMIGLARQAGLDTEALEQEKKRRIMALNYQYQEQMWKLKENVGLSWADQYRHELDDLDNMHTQGLISEKGYQKKRLDLAVAYGKKQFDFYTGLGASMFTELQNAEIAQSEAKYDVLIQQAKNNNEDTAELEQEKENKKLEIQKKYADVNFAVKISQIIADTAVSIMKAFAELGPIGGAIAAAMLTATDAAQVMSAKAERDKIKNMQPGKVSSGESSKPAVAERVLTGYAEGGYTGDGDRYEVAGLVHRGEYVVPKPIMSDRRVIDAVGTIESIRRSHRPRASYREDLPGYAEGGMVGVPATIDVDKFCQAVDRFEASAANLKAYVVLRDFDYARDQQDRARAPFTRPKK